MKIEHIAIWVKHLDEQISFYTKWFEATPGKKYRNPETEKLFFGWAHLAVSVGSKENVDFLTKEMEKSGIEVVGQPRTTGDGYYESVIRDPEGNLIEITF